MSGDLPRGPRLKAFLLLPAVTLLLFSGLTALSFIQIRAKGRVPAARSSPAAASREVMDRYRSETKELEALREGSRADLSGEDILKALRAEKPEGHPPAEVLIAQLRSIEKRSKGLPADLAPKLLSLIQGAGGSSGSEVRLERAEALFAHLAYASECLELTGGEKKLLIDLLRSALERKSGNLGGYLTALSLAGDERDAAAVLELKGLAQDGQLAHELEKLIGALEARTSSRAEGER